MGKRDKLRALITDVSRKGGIKKIRIDDVIDYLEDEYLRRYRYKIHLNARIVGQIFSEFKNIESIRLKKQINGRNKISVYTSYIIHPLISGRVPLNIWCDKKMGHKHRWKDYEIFQDGRFQYCTKCGLILRVEDVTTLNAVEVKQK